ncbi:MAG: 30S ribosomal protein S20, partial [Anaerolineales bacterium]|nr:30S ribosomal protein S20 [Anaerolineales bacterium]
ASAQKRIRSNERKRLRNQRTRSRTRTAVRLARSGLAGVAAEVAHKTAQVTTGAADKAADKVKALLEEARRNVLAAASALDRAAAKGVLHKNNAARRKSRLMKKLAAQEKAIA